MKKLKLVLLSILLIPDATRAQVQFGTIIVLNYSKDRLVVAADSRGVNGNGRRPPDDSQCKLATFGQETLFATGGAAVRFKISPFDTVDEWRNSDLARVAINEIAAKNLEGDVRLQAIVLKWAQLLATNWSSLYLSHPKQVIKTAEEGNGVLTYGFFAEAHKGEVYLYGVGVGFNPADTPPIKVLEITPTPCWPCGQQGKLSLCAVGQNVVPAGLCSAVDNGATQKQLVKHLRQFDLQESIAINIVQITRECDLTETVGGPVDALELTREGSLKWLLNSKQCP